LRALETQLKVTSVPPMRGWIPTHDIAGNLFATTSLLKVCLHWNVRFVITKGSKAVEYHGAHTSLHVFAKLGHGTCILATGSLKSITTSALPLLLEETAYRPFGLT